MHIECFKIGVQDPIWPLASSTKIISPRLEAGGLAQGAEVIFASGFLPFRSLTVAGLHRRRLTPDALPSVGMEQAHCHGQE